MNLIAIKKLLCKELVQDVAERHTRSFLITSFLYPDGDFVNLYADSRGEETWLTDSGVTINKCERDGVRFTESHAQRAESICNLYGVTLKNRSISKRLATNTAGTDYISLCEAITRISNLQYENDQRERSMLEHDIESLLLERVVPQRAYYKKWTDKLIDENGSYPVDFRVNGKGEPRHIFQVSSAAKSTLVAAVSAFHRLHHRNVPTLSIVRKELVLNDHEWDRLRRASTEVRQGLVGHEDAVVEFALSGLMV